MHEQYIVKKSVYMLLILLLTSYLCSCPAPFNQNNPVDSGADNYQGFEAVGSIEEIAPYSPDAEEFIYPIFTSSVSAEGSVDLYDFQVNDSEDFSSPLLEKSSIGSNIATFDNTSLSSGTTLYWRVRAHSGESGTWSDWSPAVNCFTSSGIDKSSIVPNDGVELNYFEIPEKFDWNNIEGANEYEISAKVNSMSFTTDDTFTVSNSEMNIDTSQGNLGDTIYWRVRPVNSDGTEGFWSNTFSFKVSSVIYKEDFEDASLGDEWYFEYMGWDITNNESYTNSASLVDQKGDMPDAGAAFANLTIDCVESATIYFAIKTDLHDSDEVRFLINDTDIESWPGYNGWAEYSFPANQGINEFSWELHRFGSDVNNVNSAWIDSIVIVAE